MRQPSFRDVELLNTYLDGELDASQARHLESRLQVDSGLKSILDDLKEARIVLRRLPQRRAPRNFTLTTKMAGIKPPLPRSYPVLRFASAFAAVLLFFSYALNILPSFSLSLGAAAPAMEMQAAAPAGDSLRSQSGGGCDDCTTEPTLMVEAPLAPSSKMAPEPEATLAPTEGDQSLQQQPIPRTENAAEEGRSKGFPQLTTIQMVLLVLAVLAGVAALIVKWVTERTFARKNKTG